MIPYTLVTPDDLCSDPGYFPCNASYCLPKSWFCDGKVDCLGGRDEDCCRKFQRFLSVCKHLLVQRQSKQ